MFEPISETHLDALLATDASTDALLQLVDEETWYSDLIWSRLKERELTSDQVVRFIVAKSHDSAWRRLQEMSPSRSQLWTLYEARRYREDVWLILRKGFSQEDCVRKISAPEHDEHSLYALRVLKMDRLSKKDLRKLMTHYELKDKAARKLLSRNPSRADLWWIVSKAHKLSDTTRMRAFRQVKDRLTVSELLQLCNLEYNPISRFAFSCLTLQDLSYDDLLSLAYCWPGAWEELVGRGGIPKKDLERLLPSKSHHDVAWDLYMSFDVTLEDMKRIFSHAGKDVSEMVGIILDRYPCPEAWRFVLSRREAFRFWHKAYVNLMSYKAE